MDRYGRHRPGGGKRYLQHARAQVQSAEETGAATLRSSIAAIDLDLSRLHSLRPPQFAGAGHEDPINEVGSILNSLDPQALATSGDAIAEGLAQMDAAVQHLDALGTTLDSERRQATELHSLSAPLDAMPAAMQRVPPSDAHAVALAKAVADALRNTADPIGTRSSLSGAA